MRKKITMDTPTDLGKTQPEMNLISDYFRTLKALLSSPTQFFHTLDLNRGMVGPLTFAVITHWVGAALAYLWQSAVGRVFQNDIRDFMGAFDKFVEIDSTDRSVMYVEMRQKVIDWMWGVGSVIVDPFKTVISILITSFFVWLGAKLLANPHVENSERRFSFETAVALVSFGYAPSILQGIPMLGSTVAWLFTFIVTLIGAREIYRVGNGRGMVIVLFPKILLFTFFFGSLALLMLLFFKLFFAAVALQ